MNRIDLIFSTFREDNSPIDNHVQYELRHQIALALEHAGFGVVQERGSDKFQNDALQPVIDDYYDDDHELLVFYNFPHTLLDNVTTLITNILPDVFTLFHDQFHMVLNVRTRFF